MKDYFSGYKTILFQGDSVTDCGRARDDIGSLGSGYPSMIEAIYRNLFPDNNVRFVNKGVSGDRAYNLIERYIEDIREIEPDFISILIGINDVWRIFDSGDQSTVEAFRDHYDYLMKMIKHDFPEAGIMIMEPFVLHALPDRAGWHAELDPRIQAVREIAAGYADHFVPLDGIFASCCTGGSSPADFAADGVHPTERGHAVIARAYLEALGVL